MKKVVWTLGMLALTSGMAFGQDVNEPVQPPPPFVQRAVPAGQHAADSVLIANERKMNDAVAKGDKAAFSALASPDAMSADGNGFMKVSEFAAVLDKVKLTSSTLTDEKVWWADPNTAIVTSTWTGAGTYMGQPVPTKTYSSTVWTKKGDKWLAVFHQESEAK